MGHHRKSPPSPVTAEFSRLVRERRVALGLSQLSLATLAGVIPSTVGDIESAGAGVTLRNALPLARALGINLMEDLPLWMT